MKYESHCWFDPNKYDVTFVQLSQKYDVWDIN